MIELVWDRGREGTATAALGKTIPVGEATDFSPEQLLATAAAGCLMRAFLQTIDEAGAPILSFAATAHLEPGLGSDASPRVCVRSFIVAPPGTVAPTILALFELAVARSPIARFLGDRAEFTASVRVLCPPGGALA